MHILSGILSVYLLGIMLLPCDDVHTHDYHEHATVEIEQGHEANVDACSPFCFCDCCQLIIQQAPVAHFSHFDNIVDAPIIPTQKSVLSVPGSLWRPPKA